MKSKKILVYVNNEFACLEMVSLLGNKKYDLTVIIEYFHKNKSIENIIKIFSVFTKKIYLIKLNQKLVRFHLKSLPLIRKNYIRNNKLSYYIHNYHIKKNIIVNSFDEVWFTNDTSSKFTCLKYSGVKKYFFHALIDMRNFKKLNIFSYLIKFFECLIDKYIFHIIPIYYNFFNGNYLSIINETVLKKKNYNQPNIIKFKPYKRFLSKFYSNIKFRKKNKKKIILINVHTFDGYNKKILKSYFENFSEAIYKILEKKHILSKYQIILKFKSIVELKNQKIVLKIFKKRFKFNNIYIADNFFKGHLPIEIFAYKIKPEIMISLNTTGDWMIKKLLPNIKIYDISSFFHLFWTKNNNLMKNSHHEVLKSMTKFNNIFNLKFEKIFIKKI